VIIAAAQEDDSLHISVVSDRLEPFRGEAVVRLRDTGNRVLKADTVSVTATNDRSVRAISYHIKSLLDSLPPERAVIQTVLLEGAQVIHQNTHLIVPPKELVIQKPLVALEATVEQGLIELTLETDVFAKSVVISTAGTDGIFSDNFLDLYPTEKVTINFAPRKSLGDKLPRFQIRSLYDVAN
jgi:hypothetical protein